MKKQPRKINKAKGPLATEPISTPEGTIRTGTRKPFRKATNEEIERRVTQLAEYMMEHPFVSRFKLHDMFCDQWGIRWDTFDTLYTPRARKHIRLVLSLTTVEAREKALGVVSRIMEQAGSKTKLRAIKAFCEITGCVVPARLEVSGPDGGPIQTEARPLANVPDERLRELAMRGKK